MARSRMTGSALNPAALAARPGQLGQRPARLTWQSRLPALQALPGHEWA